jgi:hypothetical protein
LFKTGLKTAKRVRRCSGRVFFAIFPKNFVVVKKGLFLVLVLIGLTQCRHDDPVAQVPAVLLGTAFKLAANDSVRVVSAGSILPLFTFAFVHMQDGRCPKNAGCTLSGDDARIDFELRANGAKTRQFLCLGDCKDWYPTLPPAMARRTEDSTTVTLAGQAFRVVLQQADTLFLRPNPATATFLVRQL